MKNYSAITHEKDITTKEYVDDKFGDCVPLNGGTMTGELVAQNNTSYSAKQVRNIILSTSTPTDGEGENGDIWITYSS